MQYAHARICSILSKAGGTAGNDNACGPAGVGDANLSLLAAPTEAALMLKLAEYPEMLQRAAAERAPHEVAFYLRDLAACLHSFYGAERVLVDDAALALARRALLSATAQVLRNALALLGVSAPVSMSREAPADATESAATEHHA